MTDKPPAGSSAAPGPSEPARDPRQPADFRPIELAKALLRQGRSGALATLGETGMPLATLVSIATLVDGTPITLTSQLSTHTRNLARDTRCSLLIAQAGKGDPLAHPRLSLTARAETLAGDTAAAARARFLARHPKAQLYVDFPDFAFVALRPETVHLNGGFARAYDGPAEEVMTALAGAAELVGIEAEAIAHMNDDHAEALALYAEKLLGQDKGPWRCCGIDPEGLDLIAGERTARLAFPDRILDGAGLRKALKALADAARAA